MFSLISPREPRSDDRTRADAADLSSHRKVQVEIERTLRDQQRYGFPHFYRGVSGFRYWGLNSRCCDGAGHCYRNGNSRTS